MKTIFTTILLVYTLQVCAQNKPALSVKQKLNIPAADIKVPAEAKLNVLTGRLPGFFRTELPHINRSKGPTFLKSMPAIFVDSTLIDVNNHLQYISPDEIEDIHIESKSVKYMHGAMYITLKNHQTLVKLLEDKLMSIKDISLLHVTQADKSKPVIYLIDNELITDTTGIRIPSMHVRKVTVTNAAETPYFKTAMPDILLMMIDTWEPVQYIREGGGLQE